MRTTDVLVGLAKSLRKARHTCLSRSAAYVLLLAPLFPPTALAGGEVVAWGINNYGQCNVPEPNADFVSIASGQRHNLGVKTDGSIVAWGFNGSGQCDVPAPNTGFVSAAAAYGYSLGLRDDGSIVAWGHCVNPPPEPNTDFVAVAAGSRYSLGLKSDGSIIAWGANNHGQCDVPAPNAGFVAIAASRNPYTLGTGHGHSLGLNLGPLGSRAERHTNGSIVVWGCCHSCVCDVPAPNLDFRAVAAGAGWHIGHPAVYCGFNLGLKNDGSIVAWGNSNAGQCDVPEPNADFVAIAAGDDAGWGGHALGLKADGSIVAWGSNDHGQCDIPGPNSGFVAIAASYQHSLGLRGEPAVGIDGQPLLSTAHRLSPGVPNPFWFSTTIRFELPTAGRARLEIFDVAGRLVRTLVEGERQPGAYAPTWHGRDDDGRAVAPGIYFVRLRATDFTATQKVIRLQ